jgi:large subunit ribosomal protein L10
MERIGRICRELMVEQLMKHLKENKNIIITNYKGLRVREIEELRNALKPISASYMVVKNSLLKRVFEQLGLKEAIKLIKGAVAVSFGGEDIVKISKILVNFKKKYSPFVIYGGFLNKELVCTEMIMELATLPTREVLLAKFISGLKSPINGFVSGLSCILRKLVGVINAIKKEVESR